MEIQSPEWISKLDLAAHGAEDAAKLLAMHWADLPECSASD